MRKQTNDNGNKIKNSVRMKRIFAGVLVTVCLTLPTAVYAREGDSGYEGGIAALQQLPGNTATKQTFDYKELSFTTGKPILLSGTLTLTKSVRQGTVSAKYDYTLSNNAEAVTLTRTLETTTTQTKNANGQISEKTVFSKTPKETLSINGVAYALQSYAMTHSNIIDVKPAVNYYAGNIAIKKVYTFANGSTVTVESDGAFFGYDQYWGSTGTQSINYHISVKTGDALKDWGGTAFVNLSSSDSKQFRYIKNEIDQMSFEGGYVQTDKGSGVMTYKSRLPVFDKNGLPTDSIIEINDSIQLSSFPSEKRLPVADTSRIKGHWSEPDINALFSLEVLKGSAVAFNPDQFMTRGEFALAFLEAAKEVPLDPALTSKTTAAKKTTGQKEVSPFGDVSVTDPDYAKFNEGYKRGILFGRSDNNFYPGDNLVVADAICFMVRSLGLERLAPNPGAVTNFKDNDSIPDYARDAVYIAEKIGLVQGDDKGYINPNNYLTKGRAAALINRYIKYMGDTMKKDYGDHAINY